MPITQDEHFYPFVLDHKPGFFLGWFLYRLFKHVSFDKNMTAALKQMHHQGSVVYAIKYRGHLDYLLYHFLFRSRRLPYPKIAFDLNMSMLLPLSHLLKVLKFYTIFFLKERRLPNPFKTGFFKDAIRDGTSSLLCLVDPKGFARRFIHAEKDNLHFLLETQKEMETPIFIVPQLILYKKTPEKHASSLKDILFGFQENPGFIRKIALFFRYHRKTFIDFGTPLNLKVFLGNQPVDRPVKEMTAEIKQLLIDSIDGQKRVILGPIMKSRQQLKEKVLEDRNIIESIENTASGNPKRLKQLRKKAGEYFDEIAADYNVTYVQLFLMILTWFWKKIFQGIDVDQAGLAVVREAARKGPLVYVPSHKSHIDYLVLNYILSMNHMHIPRVAAGRNLAFWPVGHIFRKAGAFFIRRSFSGAKLYTSVFTMYIKTLLKEGHPIEFFIEGGRSRSGKLVLPKIGFLSILLQAHREGYCDDLMFVPASISYDRILEEQAYLKEIGGGEKNRENFQQILKARRFLKRKYGKIYIRFGRPLSLKEYLHENEDIKGKIDRHLALNIVQSINKVTLATPLAIIASAILSKHRRGFLLHELISTVEILCKFLKRYETPMASTLDHIEKTTRETISFLIKGKMMNFLSDKDGEETFYYVDEEKKPQMEYYKNSIIHCFISHAFVAVSLLAGKYEIKGFESIRTDYGFLKTLFRNEFVFDEEEKDIEEINEAVAYFLEASFITKDYDGKGYRLTIQGFDKLPIWASQVKTFLESYWIAARSFTESEHGKKGKHLKNMNYMGLRFHKLGLIDHMEAVSQINFKNAIPVISKGIPMEAKVSNDGPGKKQKLLQLGQRIYELSRFRA